MSLSKSLTHNAVGEEKEEETSQSLIADLYSGYDTSTGKKTKTNKTKEDRSSTQTLHVWSSPIVSVISRKKTDEDFKVS